MKTLLRYALISIAFLLILLLSGCDTKRIVEVLREGIQTYAPGQWEISINRILTKLDQVGGDLAHQVANEIKGVMEDAKIQMEQLAGYGENTAFCTVEFVGERVEIKLKKIAHDFFPKDFPEVKYFPSICNVVPYEIHSNDTLNIVFYGFDFANYQERYSVAIQEELSEVEVKKNVAAFNVNHNYQGTIQIRADDMKDLDPNKKYRIVLQWDNTNLPVGKSSRSEVSILPAPVVVIPPTPVPPLPTSYVTDWFSEEDPGQYCQSGYAVQAIQCGGDDCDDLQLTCTPYMAGDDVTRVVQDGPWISEEGPMNDFRFYQGFLIGIQCEHDYCDNMLPKVITSQIIQNADSCESSPFFSEEDGRPFGCRPGYFVSGFACNDDYCDNISIFCCKAKINWP